VSRTATTVAEARFVLFSAAMHEKFAAALDALGGG
jgi:hypothetical protein